MSLVEVKTNRYQVDIRPCQTTLARCVSLQTAQFVSIFLKEKSFKDLGQLSNTCLVSTKYKIKDQETEPKRKNIASGEITEEKVFNLFSILKQKY